MLKYYFDVVLPSALACDGIKDKKYETKNKNNNELLGLIKARWSNLKDKIENMSEDGKKADKILKIVKEILDFNKEIQNQ